MLSSCFLGILGKTMERSLIQFTFTLQALLFLHQTLPLLPHPLIGLHLLRCLHSEFVCPDAAFRFDNGTKCHAGHLDEDFEWEGQATVEWGVPIKESGSEGGDGAILLWRDSVREELRFRERQY